MKYLYSLIIIILSVYLLSCSDDKDERLLQLAENEMINYNFSDSALIFLETIDYPDKLSKENYAKYIFLLTKAHYRNKVSIENDTLITNAINFYKMTNNTWHLAESNLYAGRIFEVRGKTNVAKKYFSDAFNLAIHSRNYEQAGRSAYGLGELYLDIKDYPKSLSWLNIALNNFRNSNQLFHEINTLRRFGDYYVITNQTDSAIFYYNKALSIVPSDNYTLKSDLYKNTAIAYFKEKNYSSAITLIKKSIKILSKEEQYPLQFHILADIYVESNYPDSAISYYRKTITHINEFSRYKTDYNEFLDKRLKSEQSEILEKYRLYKTISDSIYQKQTYEPTIPLTKSHNKERLLFLNKTLWEQNRRYIIFIIIVMGAIPITIYFGLKLLRKREQDVTNKEKTIKIMEIERKNFEETIITHKISSHEILKGYMRMVQLSISPQKNRYKNFLLEYNKLMYNNDEYFSFNWDIFSDLLNNAANNYLYKLKETFDNLTDKEIQTIAMQKAGFEIVDIAELLEYSINTVYKRNSDIRKKLKIVESGNIIEFIDKKLYNTSPPISS